MLPPSDQLTETTEQYRQLAGQLAEIGLIAQGSITRRYTRCGTPTCRCHADPPQPHGPYWQHTTKINGKTITRRLTEHQATLYTQWISNDRHLQHIITQMRQTAAKATEILLNTTET